MGRFYMARNPCVRPLNKRRYQNHSLSVGLLICSSLSLTALLIYFFSVSFNDDARVYAASLV